MRNIRMHGPHLRFSPSWGRHWSFVCQTLRLGYVTKVKLMSHPCLDVIRTQTEANRGEIW